MTTNEQTNKPKVPKSIKYIYFTLFFGYSVYWLLANTVCDWYMNKFLMALFYIMCGGAYYLSDKKASIPDWLAYGFLFLIGLSDTLSA